ncbi:MAG: hypothetical protein AAF465_10480 [Pseudomonadota bacterium]
MNSAESKSRTILLVTVFVALLAVCLVMIHLLRSPRISGRSEVDIIDQFVVMRIESIERGVRQGPTPLYVRLEASRHPQGRGPYFRVGEARLDRDSANHPAHSQHAFINVVLTSDLHWPQAGGTYSWFLSLYSSPDAVQPLDRVALPGRYVFVRRERQNAMLK